jgi:hypothetical protein
MGAILRIAIAIGALGILTACEDVVLESAIASGEVAYDIEVRTNALLSDIDGRSAGFATPVAISESLLPAGTTRTDVAALMDEWGFEPIPEDSQTLRITQWFPEALDPAAQAYSGPLLSDGVCGIQFLAIAEFDDAGNLIRAEGWKGEAGCL